MTPPDEPRSPADALFDQRLREALSPPPEQTERIVRRALTATGAGDGGRLRTLRLRPLVPAASLVVLLTAATVFRHLGIDLAAKWTDAQGRPQSIVADGGRPIPELSS